MNAIETGRIKYSSKKGHTTLAVKLEKVGENEKEHNINSLRHSEYTIYTDGSKKEEGTGGGFVIYHYKKLFFFFFFGAPIWG